MRQIEMLLLNERERERKGEKGVKERERKRVRERGGGNERKEREREIQRNIFTTKQYFGISVDSKQSVKKFIYIYLFK